MTPAQLREYLAQLERERAAIVARLEARKRAGATSNHDRDATRQERRLAALIAEGQGLMSRPAWKWVEPSERE